ncbi:uncharacterized protein [Nicotiana tomentosiformis]|uniref:uncharacterized protein n=1 Tax=Nicotiana tomentosiformis TaxID=4098 RepID=UPI00388C8623
MTVTQYEIRFSKLARHGIWLIPTQRKKIRRFIDGLNYSIRFIMAREVAMGARFDEVANIARRLELVSRQEHEEREAKRPHSSGVFGSASSGGQSYYSRGRSSRPVQAARHVPRGSSVSHSSYSARPSQSSFSALPEQRSYHASFAQGFSSSYSDYQGHQLHQMRGCFECGELSHLKRD